MAWDPAQYLKFGGERLRPALDLLARAPGEEPAHVVDLGCGTGTITRILAERFPRAKVTGVDGSAEMLAKSVKEVPTGGHVSWQQADIAGWTATTPVELIYSNAALQWLKEHDKLFPHLVGQLAPGGALMVQMPRNHGAPSHRLMESSIARRPALVERLRSKPRSWPPGEPGHYYDMLRPRCASVDIWETEYLHVLEGADPVVEWTKGTALKPVLDSLEPAEREDFLVEYKAGCRAAYPPRPDGRTLFPFRRIFIVAVK